jgi:hypothetical protein
MSHHLRNLLLSLLLATSATAGCTLIAEVDRSKIPDEGEVGGNGGTDGNDNQAGAGGAE